jgi:hypothetical protein
LLASFLEFVLLGRAVYYTNASFSPIATIVLGLMGFLSRLIPFTSTFSTATESSLISLDTAAAVSLLYKKVYQSHYLLFAQLQTDININSRFISSTAQTIAFSLSVVPDQILDYSSNIIERLK